jgi:diguanylate cyclase (GGDEF)-like protein
MGIWKRPVPAAHLCLVLLYAATLAASTVALHNGLLPYKVVAEVARFVFGLIGLVAAVRALHGPALPPRARQAWRAVAVSFAVLVASPAMLLLLGDRVSAVDDVTHLAFVLALLIALQLFPLAATTRRDRWKTGLDALTVLVGGSMVLWFISFGPYVHDHGISLTVVVTAGVYPICDLALLFSVARILLRGADESAQGPLRPLAAGTLVLLVGDAVHGYLHGHGQIELHSPWQFVCWITADALLAAAAVEQCRISAPTAREERHGRLSARYLPYVAVATAHLLMLAAAVQERSFYPWGGLAIGGAVLSAIVLFRQTLVQRESDERAVTDGLTGLANRSRFRATSNRALARSVRTGLHTAVLVIDMNGFKEVNDTLGHKSGDLVLVEFAEVLRRCVPASGLACRLGGDEFAVVLADLEQPERAYAVAAAIVAGMGPVVIEGKLITMAASIGTAVSRPGELTHDEIVHRADTAMYQAKRLGTDSHWVGWQESFEHQPAVA